MHRSPAIAFFTSRAKQFCVARHCLAVRWLPLPRPLTQLRVQYSRATGFYMKVYRWTARIECIGVACLWSLHIACRPARVVCIELQLLVARGKPAQARLEKACPGIVSNSKFSLFHLNSFTMAYRCLSSAKQNTFFILTTEIK